MTEFDYIDPLITEIEHYKERHDALTDYVSKQQQVINNIKAENKRLREALTEIAESDEIAQHIAQQANEELDRKVAEAQGWKLLTGDLANEPDYWVNGNIYKCDYHPSTNWQQAGELVEKYKIDLEYVDTNWEATIWDLLNNVPIAETAADTPTRAICLATVASVFGDEVSDER